MSRKTIRKITFAVSLIIILCFAIYLVINYYGTNPGAANGQEKLSVTVLDVGQGDSILITLGEDTMLIDAAEKSESDNIIEELNSRGINDIDILVATHPHSDHIGGMSEIIQNVEVSEIYMAETDSDTKTYENLKALIEEKNIRLIEAYAGLEFDLGQASCTIVSPSRSADDDSNNESVAIFLDYYNSEFLFTGDMEEPAEDDMLSSVYLIDADILKVAHHGSSTGTSEEFLRAVSPDYAAISVGSGNIYKHPNKETIDLLNEYNIKTYRTDMSGNITFISDGQSIDVVLEK